MFLHELNEFMHELNKFIHELLEFFLWFILTIYKQKIGLKMFSAIYEFLEKN